MVHSPSNDKPALPASGACHYNDVLMFLISRITGQEAGFPRIAQVHGQDSRRCRALQRTPNPPLDWRRHTSCRKRSR